MFFRRILRSGFGKTTARAFSTTSYCPKLEASLRQATQSFKSPQARTFIHQARECQREAGYNNDTFWVSTLAKQGIQSLGQTFANFDQHIAFADKYLGGVLTWEQAQLLTEQITRGEIKPSHWLASSCALTRSGNALHPATASETRHYHDRVQVGRPHCSETGTLKFDYRQHFAIMTNLPASLMEMPVVVSFARANPTKVHFYMGGKTVVESIGKGGEKQIWVPKAFAGINPMCLFHAHISKVVTQNPGNFYGTWNREIVSECGEVAWKKSGVEQDSAPTIELPASPSLK